MPLSPVVTKELKRELTDLKRTRGRVDARISALETLLKFDRAGEEAPAVRAISQRLKAPKRMKSSRKNAARHAHGSLGAKLSALIEKTPGLRSGGIIQALEQTGFSVGGKTPLRDRVYHELRRLGQVGVIRKDSSGAYAPAKNKQHEREQDGVDRAEPVEVVVG